MIICARNSKNESAKAEYISSEALKQFRVTVSQAEEKEETEILQAKPSPIPRSAEMVTWFNVPTFTVDPSKPLMDQMFTYLPPAQL